MAKNNVYDFILGELIYRSTISNNIGGPSLEISSSLLFNDRAPLNFNGTAAFTSTVKNTPVGYTVRASTHIMFYPIIFGPDFSSNNSFTGGNAPIIFTSILDSFTVNSTVTLEKAGSPDIVLNGSITVQASSVILFGSKTTNNSFITSALNSTVFAAQNQTVLLAPASFNYIYFVFPTGGALPLYLKDRNGLVIEFSNFTMNSAGGYDYYVLNWATTIPTNSYWELVYTP